MSSLGFSSRVDGRQRSVCKVGSTDFGRRQILCTRDLRFLDPSFVLRRRVTETLEPVQDIGETLKQKSRYFTRNLVVTKVSQ